MAESLDLLATGAGLDVAQPIEGLDLLADPNAPGPFRKGIGAGIAGVKSSFYGAGALAAHAIGAQKLEKAALDSAAEQGAIASESAQPVEKVDWSSPGAVVNQFKFLLGQAVPSLATMFAGGVAGRGLGALAGRTMAAPAAAAATRAGTYAGAIAPDVAMEAGSIYPEALETGVANPALRAAAGGAAAASLDFLPLLAAERYLKAAGRGGFGAMAKGAAKGAPVGAALEGTQEALQTGIERAAAGQNLTDEQAISDYINSFAGGAAPGVVLGGAVGAARGRAPAPTVQKPAVFTEREPSSIPEQPSVVDTQDVGTTAQVPTLTPDIQHTLATQAMADTSAAIEQVRAEHEAAGARMKELEAEAKIPNIADRRTMSEIVVERKGLVATRKATKGKITTLETQYDEARKAVAALEPQLAAKTAAPIIPNLGAVAPDLGIVEPTAPMIPPVTKTEAEHVQEATRGAAAFVAQQGLAPAAPVAAPAPKTRRAAAVAKTDIVNPPPAAKVVNVVGAVRDQMKAREPALRELVMSKLKGSPGGKATIADATLRRLTLIAQNAHAETTPEAQVAYIKGEIVKQGLDKRFPAKELDSVVQDIHGAVVGAATRFSKGAAEAPAALTSDQFETLPQAAQQAAVDYYDRVMTERGNQLITRVRDIVGNDPNLTVTTFTAAPGSPIGGYTRTGPLKSVISLAVNAKNELSVADHEGFHYAEDRVLDGRERQIITNALKNDRPLFKQLLEKVQQYDRENKTNLADEIQGVPAERRAYAFEFWKRGELEAEGPLARVFQKIQQFLERIANAVNGLGFQSIEDIFTALDRGQYSERTRNEASGIAGLDSRAAQQEWYRSQLNDAVAALPTKVAPPQGWKDQIKGLVAKGAVKQTEIDAVGLNDWLDLQQGKVTKQQVADFIAQNGVKVEETELGGDAEINHLASPLPNGNEWVLSRRGGKDQVYFKTTQDAEAYAAKNGWSLAAYASASYQLPGGENYRELLLTLPSQAKRTVEQSADGSWRVISEAGSASFGKTREEALKNFEAQQKGISGFVSSHFDQPNILAHIRFNERTDADGKRVLFIEEIQSDWAQKGKKEGFADDKPVYTELPEGYNVRSRKEAGDANVTRYWVEDATGKRVSADSYNKEGAVNGVINDLNDKARGTTASPVPNAPFVTKTEAWVALSLKRMIRYAAENGFDKVAWTNGEQQAARYDLSKYVDRIAVNPAPNQNGMFDLEAYDDEGKKIIDEVVPLNKIEDYIGKEAAGKAINQIEAIGNADLGNVDIKVGSEGMKAFYDKIVPNVANDVLKKLGGGRVESIQMGISSKELAAAIETGDFGDGSVEAGGRMQPGFTITPEMAIRAANGLPLFSKAAVDMDRQMKAGELQQMQANEAGARLMEAAAGTSATWRSAVEGLGLEATGSLSRWWQKYISTPNFIAHFSDGFKNVFRVLNTYNRYSSVLIKQMLKEQMPEWYTARKSDQDATFAALTKRNVGKFLKGSPEYQELLATLTPEQQTMFASATRMVEGFLLKELEVDKAFYKQAYSDPKEYETWLAGRQTQVDDLIAHGYEPLERFGDHTVTVLMPFTDAKGRVQNLAAVHQQFESQADAHKMAEIYKAELARTGSTLSVETGIRHKTSRDATISVQQFLDTARRNGVALSQPETERIVKALTAADSMVRNRMMRRKEVPGYSTDGMRVLNSFGVKMAGKIAYAKFASAIDASLSGRAVDADLVQGPNGEMVPEIIVDELRGEAGATETADEFEKRNLWKIEGAKGGFARNLADEVSDYVLVPDHTGMWSRKLRAAAMMYFIGGSISGAVVNVMSIPMLLVPQLSVHTDYQTAAAASLSAWKLTWQHQAILRDIVRLKDKDNNPLPGIDEIAGLREALITASEDGRTMDTEIHQITGMAQGAMFSQSRTVQKAMEVWMSPFRLSEQTNRITAFIAAYKVAATGKGVRQSDGSFLTIGGQELYRFAGEMVDATQNNYNAANRPGAARHPIYAMLFMFKSFPLFMTEAIVLMHKANPKSAVYMLLGLTLMTGVQGLPFAETLENLIDVLAQRVFGSPFNTRRAMRNVIKSASEAMVGYDASELVMRGMVNEIFGISMSSRIGAGDFVPGTRLGAAESEQGRILQDLLGAPYAMVKDAAAQAGKFTGGVFTGDWKQTMDALRAGGPVAVRNVIKGGEQLVDGFASDARGRKVVDVTGMEALLQLTGLAPATVAKMYEYESINIQTKAFYNQVSRDMQDQLVQAMKDNDVTKVQEINDLRNAWNQSYPTMPILPNVSAARRAIILAGVPLDRRSQMLWGRRIRGENIFSEGSE